jgi:hypothetical protein
MMKELAAIATVVASKPKVQIKIDFPSEPTPPSPPRQQQQQFQIEVSDYSERLPPQTNQITFKVEMEDDNECDVTGKPQYDCDVIERAQYDCDVIETPRLEVSYLSMSISEPSLPLATRHFLTVPSGDF